MTSTASFYPPAAPPPGGFRRAFTMMELIVAVGILVIIILSVGITFSGASKSVSVSNATMEMMSSVRAAQGSLERDLLRLDRNGFLVIRSRVLNTSQAVVPADTTRRFIDISPHYDQISFLAQGLFTNTSGADTGTPFADSSAASAAHVWWGQLIVEKTGANANPALGPFPSYVPPNEAAVYGPAQPPTGVYSNGSSLVVTKETDFVLGRHATLLMPGPADANSHLMPAGQNLLAYASIDCTSGQLLHGTADSGFNAHITSSRNGIVAESPSQLMQEIAFHRGPPALEPYPEVDRYTYRFRCLSSIYDTELANFANGYFRMTPSVMAGVSSFQVEWSNGDLYPAGDPFGRDGQFKWYGAANPCGLAGTEQYNLGGLPSGDQYIATFSYWNKDQWPKALRITMHVYSDRLDGGRDFVQVVNLLQ